MAARAAADADFRMYGSRWLMLLLFFSASLCNAMLGISFAAIASLAQRYYSVSGTAITLLALVYMVAFLPGTLLAAAVTDRFGPRSAVTSACFGNALSGVLRYVSAGSEEAAAGAGSTGYVLVLLGQIVGAVSQPVFLNLPARISYEWFDESQRNVATTVLAMANVIGVAAGQTLSSVMVTDTGGMPLFLLVTMLFAMIVLVFTLVLFRGAPRTPPTRSAHHRADTRALAAQHASPTAQLWQDTKAIFSNRSYIALSIGFGIGLGLFNTLLTLVETLISPAGYSTDDAGVFVGSSIGAGLLAAGMVGLVMDATHAYALLLRIGTLAGTVSFAFAMAAIRPDNKAGVLAGFVLVGAFITPLLPVSMETAAEVTYPVPEEVSSGFLMLIGNVLSVALVFFVEATSVKNYTTVITANAATIVGGMALTFMASLFVRPPYKRLEAGLAHVHNTKPEEV